MENFISISILAWEWRRKSKRLDFIRHHYAATNINRWADDTFEFGQKLHYLSKSMGHRSIESTLYYYSMTPFLADILLKKTEKSFNELLPEVGHEEI